MHQRVRYLKTPDGVHLAWAEAGAGPVLVKPSNWLTHLEHDWNSPLWRHWLTFFAERFRMIRYDERGCGMSDRAAGDVSTARWLGDLRCVVTAARVKSPFTLLGVSQGAAAAVQYAAEHPERVSRLVLYGGYARGWARRGQPEVERVQRAMVELMRHGWGSDNPAFRNVFTSRFLPDGTDERFRWLDEMFQRTDAATAMRLIEARAATDVSAALPRVRAPTLVLHARGDQMVPIAEGRLLAADIPNASFVELPSRNHILLEHEPAWNVFRERVLDFLRDDGPPVPDRGDRFAALSPREREVLAAVGDGLTNAQVADRLAISEKTVRNHLSSLFAKLGIHSRAQAIVMLRRDKVPIH